VIGRKNNFIIDKGGAVSPKPAKNRPGGHDRVNDSSEEVDGRFEILNDWAGVIRGNQIQAVTHGGDVLPRAASKKLADCDGGFGSVAMAEVAVLRINPKETFPRGLGQDVENLCDHFEDEIGGVFHESSRQDYSVTQKSVRLTREVILQHFPKNLRTERFRQDPALTHSSPQECCFNRMSAVGQIPCQRSRIGEFNKIKVLCDQFSKSGN